MKLQKFLPELIQEASFVKPMTRELSIKEFKEVDRKLTRYAVNKFSRLIADCNFEVPFEKFEKVINTEFLNKLAPTWLSARITDPVFWNNVMTQANYISDPSSKVYVMEKDFFKEFLNIKVDKLKFTHLPKERLTGYVEFPYEIPDTDEDLFKGFMFTVGDTKYQRECQRKILQHTNKILDTLGANQRFALEPNAFTGTNVTFTYYTSGFDAIFGKHDTSFPEDTNTSLKDHLANTIVNHIRPVFMPGHMEHGFVDADKTIIADGYTGHTALMFNLLAYLNSGNPDLRLFRNKLTYRGNSSKKLTNESKKLSQEKIVLVGFNYKKDPSYSVDKTTVRTHPRWVPCGPGRQQIKLVWVRQHERHFKNVIQSDSNIERIQDA